jgi:hypothetical protein
MVQLDSDRDYAGVVCDQFCDSVEDISMAIILVIWAGQLTSSQENNYHVC